MRLLHLAVVPLLITASCGSGGASERADSAPAAEVANACAVVPDNFLAAALGATAEPRSTRGGPDTAEYACTFHPSAETGRTVRVLSFSGTEIFDNLPDDDPVDGIGERAVSFSDSAGFYFETVGFVVAGNTYAVELNSDDFLDGADHGALLVLAEQIANALA